ncbi:fused response regulator/thioredoxin-disulfide reductase [Pedobacter psychrophilus]|uniref:Fused response regulator/thioredoxin-disulfide reductase n=1 Tax=Pedobacter psychrophilus TaxID=1826909 RepID=A0A179DBF8_9SPHI|nr:FAD-dependent oxidoreductase [Pedobacter psychrophilus]OAQ38385.1 fused response regulator/thioredoxin-disulfide reductase [Pedobacter psychrophilus]
MSLPIIFSIDDDVQVLRALSRDLKTKYRESYKILSTSSVSEAFEVLKELQNKGEEIALFISDQRMPDMQGVDFLEKVKELFPFAKKVLLTAYSDTDAAIKAINAVQLDYYLMKPWDPPEEKLYPAIDELLNDWQANYRPDFKGIKVLGYQFSAQSHQIKDFLAGNLIPYLWMDIKTNDQAIQLCKANNLEAKDFPTIIFEDGTLLKNPTIIDVATMIGLNPDVKNQIYDVVIIGAGPAGLAASVYGASEGLSTLLIERKAPGGQAGTSSRIENYLGFPTGLSGADLTRRAISQATRFGTEFLSPQSVQDIKQKDNYKIITLESGKEINAKAIVITTGVDYKKLDTKGMNNFSGAGIYYGAAMTEAASCRDKQVYVLGGGNSAGQAAMHLSKFAKQVYIIIRKPDLRSSMSSYLIDQILNTPNIKITACTEIIEAYGDDHLNALRLVDLNSNEEKNVDADALYIFIGAKPYTDWIGLNIIKNDKGFIETGRELNSYDNFKQIWKKGRDPFLLETSAAGIFAAGDVRAGAMNRVASAVGEGSMAISFVHKYLAEI